MENLNDHNFEYYNNLIERFEKNPILFLPEKSNIAFEELDKMRLEVGATVLYACDFSIDGIEEFEKEGYFERDGIVNIDHHSESPNYKKYISSANLAMEYIKNHPDFLIGSRALTHHTDCDSVLSSALMSGILLPEERFGDAVIAADHTGEANEIADLLQALKDGPSGEVKEKSTAEKNKEKYLYALRQLQKFLTGEELDEEARKLYEKRLKERLFLQEIIRRGDLKYSGANNEVAYLETDQEKFDATLLVGLLPNAKIIFTARKGVDDKTIINVRLGRAIKPGTDLRDIMDNANEPFGGRWNAGANKRKGGSISTPAEIAKKITSVLENIH